MAKAHSVTPEGVESTRQQLESNAATALRAIQDEILKVLRIIGSEQLRKRLLLIESICRHGYDVRSEDEKARN